MNLAITICGNVTEYVYICTLKLRKECNLLEMSVG